MTEAAQIQTICNGQKRTETYTDSHGGFSFEFATRNSMSTGLGAGIGEADTTPGYTNAMGSTTRDYRTCELQAYLPGFTSETIELGARFSGSENYDVGRIVLHRMQQVQGLTISATTAAAPDSAKKAFSKGLDKAKKEKWGEAQNLFEKAVEIYPKFAVAWYELGRVQLQQNASSDARRAFEQAVAADSTYVNPYRGLTQIAVLAHQWHEVLQYTDKVVALDPVDFPDAWFYNSAANYFGRNFAAAANSAEQGIKADGQHRVPKLEYLLAMSLMNSNNYQAALEHMQRFLEIAKDPADIVEGHKQLDVIQQLSAAAKTPPAAGRK